MIRKGNVLLLTSVLFALILTGCGGGAAAPEPEAEATTAAVTVTEAAVKTEAATETEAAAETKKELSDDDLFEIVFDEAPVDEFSADNKKIRRKKNGTILFTFNTADGEYAYTIDANTGEILEKVEPEKTSTSSSDESFTEDDVFDALKEQCPVDYAAGENLKIKKNQDGSAIEVSFNTSDGDFFYKFDTKTGELLEKREPEHITDQAKEKSGGGDPFSEAISQCCKYANVSPGEAKDMHIKEIGKGESYQVTFTYNGEDYDLIYNPSTGKVEENK